MKRMILIIVVLLCAAPAMASDIGTVYGVVSSKDGQPVSGAVVTATGPASVEKVVIANTDGGYAIRMIPVGQYSLKASAAGYETSTKVIDLQKDANREVDFELTSDPWSGGPELSHD